MVDLANAINDANGKKTTFGSYAGFGISRAFAKGTWAKPIDYWGFYNYEDYFSREDYGFGAQDGISIKFSFNMPFGFNKSKNSSLMFASGLDVTFSKLDWDTLIYIGINNESIDYDNINFKTFTLTGFVGLGYEHKLKEWITLEIYNYFGGFTTDGGNFSCSYYSHNIFEDTYKETSFTDYRFKNKIGFAYSIEAAIRFPYIKIAVEYWTGTHKYTMTEMHNNLYNDNNDYEKVRDGKKTINFLKLSLIYTLAYD